MGVFVFVEYSLGALDRGERKESGNLTTWPRATAAKGTTRKMEERMILILNGCFDGGNDA